jgi:hypothetical protein
MRSGAGLGLPLRPRLLGDADVAQGPLAAALAGRTRPDVRFLHDRATPGTGAGIDHIAIAPGGVWVIDARRHVGEAHVAGRGREQSLWVGRDDRSGLVDALERQVHLVSRVVEEIAPDVRTFGALCLIDAELPPFRTLTVRGIPLCSIEALAKRLNVDGAVDSVWAGLLAEELALAFPGV